jgi:hypothetical protein
MRVYKKRIITFLAKKTCGQHRWEGCKERFPHGILRKLPNKEILNSGTY